MTETKKQVRRRRRIGHLKGSLRKIDFKVEKIPGTLNEKLTKFEVVLTPEEDKLFVPQIDHAFDQWLKGKIEPLFTKGGLKSSAVTKQEIVSTPAVEGKKIKHTLTIIPLTKQFILAVKLFIETDKDGYHEDEDGKKISPWANFVFGDGSRVHLALKKKRGR